MLYIDLDIFHEKDTTVQCENRQDQQTDFKLWTFGCNNNNIY